MYVYFAYSLFPCGSVGVQGIYSSKENAEYDAIYPDLVKILKVKLDDEANFEIGGGIPEDNDWDD